MARPKKIKEEVAVEETIPTLTEAFGEPEQEVVVKKPFERIMIMEYELTGIGKIKMTVGVRRRTLEKVQYCITAISSE